MAKTRAGRIGRLLLIVVALVLALPAIAGGAYGESVSATAKSAAHSASPGSASPDSDSPDGDSPDDVQWASKTSEHPESGADRCRTRHGGRSTATVSAPHPPRTTVSSAGPVRTESGLSVTVPLTGRRAVPLSRSGELPVRHLVIRC
ncbi:hypothetical protein SAMN06272775_2969 [Streptomyces sp. 2323.1]|uniref:hypothetical protein n=1 Tax=Streptomyces sp. 2323.1 TaxID=1938841 RepID=UPI000BB7BA10|nr:hypothetical protein [Streptomyces sp. 2323.1]SOE11980.1 hypothetical protein SAMN06272775_2969 [Streptomyces sp. 2323.1]